MPVEVDYPGVYIEELPSGVRPIAGVATSITAFAGWTPTGPTDRAEAVSSWTDFESKFGGLHTCSLLSYSVYHFFDNGGRQAYIIRLANPDTIAQADTVLRPNESGFENALLPASGNGGVFHLDSVDLFNILCVPGETNPDIIAALQTFCRVRRAFLIVDCDEADRFDDLRAGPGEIAGADSINSAFYFPWVLAPDRLDEDRPREFPPSGFVAGLYARSDEKRGVWNAPAGTGSSLTGVIGIAPEKTITDRENGVLNPKAINCIRKFPVYGTVAWGARTLRGSDDRRSEWGYIPVRRMALFIQESLYRGLKWAVFEPNDEPLWAQIRLNVGAFMHDLFRRGAFQGTRARDAYFVKCDRETTTQNDADLGVVNVLVGFAPLKPAEFVIISIRQVTKPREVGPRQHYSQENVTMANASVNPRRFDPYKNFKFRLIPRVSKPKPEQLRLAQPELVVLDQIVDQARRRDLINDSLSPGERALFVGQKGTGKTMAAEVIADSLGADLYRVDLSKIVSKYIGETEKHLARVFDAAEQTGAVLLFDEADALFGKRSEVKDSHDRYANTAVSYFLQRLESHPGVAIMATTMKGSIDPAFIRRLRFVVNFPPPGPPPN